MEKSYVSAIIEAPVGEVWKCLRNFDAVVEYYDRVESATIADGKSPDTVGCERIAVLQDGSSVREQLLGLSDADHSATYSLLTPGLGLEGYEATVRLLPITDRNHTFIEWSSTYEVVGADPQAIHNFIEKDVYLACMRGLQKLFKHR